MRLLITGICGFAGSVLARKLADQISGIEVVGLDNLSRPGSWGNREMLTQRGIRIWHGDVRCAVDIEGVGRCDWIIDAAANASVLAGVNGSASSRQLVDNNLGSTINLLEACKAWDAGFILLSTSRVYSIPPLAALAVEVHNGAFRPVFPCPISEVRLPISDLSPSDPISASQHFSVSASPNISPAGITESFSTAAPVSLYGATKLASEQLALEYGNAFGFPVWINRCGVMAGAGQFGRPDQGIFAFWLHSWREKRPLKYIGFGGSGHQARDCLHPQDLIGVLLQQMAEPATSSKPRVINLSGGVSSARSLAQLSSWCAERWDIQPIASDHSPRPYDLPWVVLDHSLATEAWGWLPGTRVETILEEVATFADAHPDWMTLSS